MKNCGTGLAITQIIARAACPTPELETARWIRENSAVCDLTRYPIEKITLQKIKSEHCNDFFLKIESEAKKQKELSMNNRFREGFEKGIESIKASLSKKSGTKVEQKVFERIGRLKQKYPSVARFYAIDYLIETKNITNKKTKEQSEPYFANNERGTVIGCLQRYP